MFHAVVEELRYADVRRHRIDGGYVQQHTLSLKARNGAVFLTGVCMVIHVTDGRVTRLEEYLDSSVLAFGQANAISQ
jgi:ketosteroid isomerase-like protein